MERHDPAGLTQRFLDVVENDIVPLTRAGVAAGNKLFGAAILTKDALSLVTAGTNEETVNPLHHGEVAALNAYFAQDHRPPAEACLFLATHEPCALCLSAITWAGFDNFTYLFAYEDTRDAFNIPHDLKILQEVFGVEGGAYRRANHYWTAQSVGDLIGASPPPAQAALSARVAAIRAIYDELSATYQSGKGRSAIALD